MTAVESRFGSAGVDAPPSPPGPGPTEPVQARTRTRGRVRVARAVLALAGLVGAVALGRLWDAHGRVGVWMTVRDFPPGLP